MQSCPRCPKRFSRPRALRRHIKGVHEKLRPHACQQCDQRFFERYRLVLHHRIVHLRERPYPCAHCNHSFADRSNRHRHMLTMHPHSVDASYSDEERSVPITPPASSSEEKDEKDLEQKVITHSTRRMCKRRRFAFGEVNDSDDEDYTPAGEARGLKKHRPTVTKNIKAHDATTCSEHDTLARYESTTEVFETECEVETQHVASLLAMLRATIHSHERQQILSQLRDEALASVHHATNMRVRLEQRQRQQYIASTDHLPCH